MVHSKKKILRLNKISGLEEIQGFKNFQGLKIRNFLTHLRHFQLSNLDAWLNIFLLFLKSLPVIWQKSKNRRFSAMNGESTQKISMLKKVGKRLATMVTYYLTPTLSESEILNNSTLLNQNWLLSRLFANIFHPLNFAEYQKLAFSWKFVLMICIEIIFWYVSKFRYAVLEKWIFETFSKKN